MHIPAARKVFRVHVGSMLLVAFVAGISFSLPASDSPDLIVVQIPKSAEFRDSTAGFLSPLYDRYVDGARIVRVSSDGGEPRNLTPEFAAALDPDVSFDASTIIFSGKRHDGDTWQLWRMNADGTGKVQITSGPGDHITPVHAGNRFFLNDPEPTPQIIFAGTEHGWRNRGTSDPVFSLYAVDYKGETVRRLTFNLYSDLSPDILPTGRVVYTSWQRFGDRFGGRGVLALSAINIDGTDFYPYYGNHEMPRYKHMAHISDFGDRVYFVEADEPTWLGGGHLAFVSMRRPHNSYYRLTDVQRGTFHSPCPLPDNRLIASYRESQGESVYELVEVDPETGRRGRRIYRDDAWHTIDAQVLVPRPRPDGKANWLIPGTPTGVLYCLNSYRTNLDNIEPLQEGQIKYVRVIEGVPHRLDSQTTDVQDTFGGRRLLGIAPVEPDGSFHIRVPAETPVTFQLLDEDYVARRTQKAWTWVMGNENRGCIGCHEDPELSPPNKMVDAIIKPAVELTLPPERRRTVDFRHQIASIFAAKCAVAGCHGAGEVPPDLSGTEQEERAFEVYKRLLGPVAGRETERFVVPGNAKDSPLTWLILNKRTGTEPTTYTGDLDAMPSHDVLSTRERIQVIEWIDLGAQWDVRTAIDHHLNVSNR